MNTIEGIYNRKVDQNQLNNVYKEQIMGGSMIQQENDLVEVPKGKNPTSLGIYL